MAFIEPMHLVNAKLLTFMVDYLQYSHNIDTPGARPTNDISIEFEIQPKFAVLWFEVSTIDHNKILHTSRECNCRDGCKISL